MVKIKRILTIVPARNNDAESFSIDFKSGWKLISLLA